MTTAHTSRDDNVTAAYASRDDSYESTTAVTAAYASRDKSLRQSWRQPTTVMTIA